MPITTAPRNGHTQRCRLTSRGARVINRANFPRFSSASSTVTRIDCFQSLALSTDTHLPFAPEGVTPLYILHWLWNDFAMLPQKRKPRSRHYTTLDIMKLR